MSLSCSKWPLCCCPQPRWQNHLSQNCVLSATIVDLHPNSINPVPGDVSIQGWHTHTHQSTSVPRDGAPTLLIVARHLWVARTPERDNPGESGTLADTADVWDTGIRIEGPHPDYLNTSRWSLLLLLLLLSSAFPIAAGTANNILNLDNTSRWSKWSTRSEKNKVDFLHLFYRIYSCQLSNHIKCWRFWRYQVLGRIHSKTVLYQN